MSTQFLERGHYWGTVGISKMQVSREEVSQLLKEQGFANVDDDVIDEFVQVGTPLCEICDEVTNLECRSSI